MSHLHCSNTLLWHKGNINDKWKCYWAGLSDSKIKLFNKEMQTLQLEKPAIKCIDITPKTELLIQSGNTILAAKLRVKTNIQWVHRWCVIVKDGYLHRIDLDSKYQIKTFDFVQSRITFRDNQKIVSMKNKNNWIQMYFDSSEMAIEWYNQLLETQITCVETRQQSKHSRDEPTLFVFTIKNKNKFDYFCANSIPEFEQWIKLINITIPKNIQLDFQLKYPLDTKVFQLVNLTDSEREQIDMWMALISNKHNYTNINYSFLARYIIHAKFKFNKAEKRFLNFKNIETEYKLNSIKLQDVAVELQQECYVMCGKDVKNRPIVCLRVNKFNRNANISIIMKALIVLMDSIASDLWVVKNGICLIFDLSNIDSNNISLLDLQKIFITAFQDAYPIMVKKFIIVNASIIPKAAISLAKIVLKKKLSERIECVTSEYPKGELWKFVNINEIPSFLGGKYCTSGPQNAWQYVTTKCVEADSNHMEQTDEKQIIESCDIMEQIGNVSVNDNNNNKDDCINDLFGDLYETKNDIKWKCKEINDWTCEELKHWVISVELNNKYEQIVLHTIGEQQITGEDFDSLEEVSDVMDSFPEINNISGNKIFAALNHVRTKPHSSEQNMSNGNNDNIANNNANISEKDENKATKEEYKKDKQNENEIAIRKWLSEVVQLPQYVQLFIENGIDCIEVLKEINIDDLNNIGIKKIGHRKRIILHINKLNDTQNNNISQSTNANIYDDEGISNKNMKQSELPEMNSLNGNDSNIIQIDESVTPYI